MYIIELLIKKWQEKRKKQKPVFEIPDDNEENLLYQNCEKHVYMAIDSTCDFLACKNCGHILRNVKQDEIKKAQDLFNNF
jgi:predicted peroxiredoxin